MGLLARHGSPRRRSYLSIHTQATYFSFSMYIQESKTLFTLYTLHYINITIIYKRHATLADIGGEKLYT